jgi:hypothetical protein
LMFLHTFTSMFQSHTTEAVQHRNISNL